jgi:hypothetical protein
LCGFVAGLCRIVAIDVAIDITIAAGRVLTVLHGLVMRGRLIVVHGARLQRGRLQRQEDQK